MKALMIALALSLTVYAGVEISDTVVPQASEHTAFVQGQLISDRAFVELELGATWEQSLTYAIENTRHNDGQLTVTGTTVRWDNGADVWCIELPTSDSLVKPVRCN
tara:strand:- start:69 stop:386 length:318 start_codon:yes stop_codon:yes gene_type:complete